LRSKTREDQLKEHPDNYDAELLLRLYDLRREPKLRQAREWLAHGFRAKSLEEFNQACPLGSEHNAFFRMVVSYWDMAASIVLHGLIKEEFFFENTSEFWMTWERVKPVAVQMRERNKNPLLWKGLETLAEKYAEWMSNRAPEALDAYRKRVLEAHPRKNP
jgi:hypothetical protein